MSILLVVGTRPEIIKMAPIIIGLEKAGIEYLFVHTGQHYDYEMSRVFIEELGLPEPHISFSLENYNSVSQIGEIMIKLERTIAGTGYRLSIALVQGDTNSTLASGLTALKLGLKLGHVEAGLRSYDWRMPEEHNRRVVDHISNYLFAPTEIAKKNLLEEQVWGEIYVTGNTVIDAIDMYLNKVGEIEHQIMSQIKFAEFGLVTFHRAENVDNPYTLRDFVRILQRSPLPLVFPVHPRTKRRLLEQGLWEEITSIPHIQLLPPIGYFELLALLKNCKVVLTDSGGLQEEATHPAILKPVLVLRTSTERPEAVYAGFAKVVGTNPVVVLRELKRILSEDIKLPKASPFGDGKASERIIFIIKSKL